MCFCRDYIHPLYQYALVIAPVQWLGFCLGSVYAEAVQYTSSASRQFGTKHTRHRREGGMTATLPGKDAISFSFTELALCTTLG